MERASPVKAVQATAVESLPLRFVEEVLNARRRSAVAELFAADYVDHDPPRDIASGRNGVHQLMDLIGRPGERFAFRLEDVIPAADRVAFRITANGYSFPPGRGGSAAARTFTVSLVGIFRIEHDLIAERWGTWRLQER